MGASGQKQAEPDSYYLSILLSFTKIKEFASEFTLKKEGKLSNIISSLLEGKKEYKSDIDDFKKNIIKDKKIKKIEDLEIHEILEYILMNLHDEFNNKKEKEKNIINHKYDSSEELCEENNSIIQKLFFGINENNAKCLNEKCRKGNKDFNFFLRKYLDKEIEPLEDIRDLINENPIEYNICEVCKGKNVIESKIVELPEIYILCINANKLKNNLNYYINFNIQNEQYNLKCFISKKDENNKHDVNYNIFYQEKGKWYIYKVVQKEQKQISKINSINGNPIIIFYQKPKILDIYYRQLSIILNDKQNILKLMNEHILDYDKYDQYYILNSQWYNKILKIYESDKIYLNDQYAINSIKDLTNISELNTQDYFQRKKNFINNKKIFKEEESFKPTYEKEEKTQINYPKNFMLIKKNVLDNLLDELLIRKDEFIKYIYQIKFGETYIFIQDKDNANIIFACSYQKNSFEVEIILKYDRSDCFSNEIKKYISNRGGLEYYYQIRNLQKDKNDVQDIKDKENDHIGILVNINNYDHMNKYKYDEKLQEEINIQNNPNNIIKMSMFPSDQQTNDNYNNQNNNQNILENMYNNFNNNNNINNQNMMMNNMNNQNMMNMNNQNMNDNMINNKVENMMNNNNNHMLDMNNNNNMMNMNNNNMINMDMMVINNNNMMNMNNNNNMMDMNNINMMDMNNNNMMNNTNNMMNNTNNMMNNTNNMMNKTNNMMNNTNNMMNNNNNNMMDMNNNNMMNNTNNMMNNTNNMMNNNNNMMNNTNNNMMDINNNNMMDMNNNMMNNTNNNMMDMNNINIMDMNNYNMMNNTNNMMNNTNNMMNMNNNNNNMMDMNNNNMMNMNNNNMMNMNNNIMNNTNNMMDINNNNMIDMNNNNMMNMNNNMMNNTNNMMNNYNNMMNNYNNM